MDTYEATRIVFSRIQSLDPENAAKIMGLLLIQDHGEKEMIRLAFGPETLLHSVIVKAKKELGLLPPSIPSTPSAGATSPSPFLLARQNSSSSRLFAGVSHSSWAPPPPHFSRSNSYSNGGLNGVDDLQNSDELVSPSNPTASPFYGGDLIDELQLQEQLSFLNDAGAAQVSAPSPIHGLPVGPKAAGGDLFYQDVIGECRSPSSNGEGMPFPYAMGWGVNGHHRRSSSAADLCLSPDLAGAGFGWNPCLYYARGFCKNGSTCRFLHGLPDDTAAAVAAGGSMDAMVEQQCQELLLRSKSQRLMASAAAFPYSPTGTLPPSPSSNKCMNFLLQQQQQQNDSQRATAAAAAAMMLGGDDSHKFIGRSRMERNDFANMMNPGSRQIYLTFPADSTFREEDVSNYFSIYGPVQDVRIPYQQKRMFGFVTFVYPETVKLILAKGNPHFVCDARVLVKPYKEKGKVPDKYRKQQQQTERVDFSDPYDLQQLGARMLYGQDILLRRKMEEQQQQQAELQQAIELQGRRFMGLHLLDLKSRSFSSSSSAATHFSTPPTISTALSDGRSSSGSREGSPPQVTEISSCHTNSHEDTAPDKESSAASGTNEGCNFQESSSSAEHNLPDSPFASPTNSSPFGMDSFSMASEAEAASAVSSNGNSHLIASMLLPATSTLETMASFKSCFFQMPRFSSDHGAVGL